MDILHELKLSAMEVPLKNLESQTHRLFHALLQGPDSWRLQLQELAGVQSVLGTANKSTHDERCPLPLARGRTHIMKLLASKRSEVAK
ncbi:hypothetical protein H257_17179 [Aphanomyces astaci]|uniref:Uncharacterized protein n=1 Tax=Aphanomyces astaci TaxID=112090 RepID=W4FI20_APHAT|nr:hypothetical protein H257_17179 [Aphanomyces astaci]ETV66398.1 hypothetical protein H257_17179 [Aphanomyces astaci]|eukprot:XP_009844173.1 hypothetical protein H257_17179 [Aphanomyces astaci]